MDKSKLLVEKVRARQEAAAAERAGKLSKQAEYLTLQVTQAAASPPEPPARTNARCCLALWLRGTLWRGRASGLRCSSCRSRCRSRAARGWDSGGGGITENPLPLNLPGADPSQEEYKAIKKEANKVAGVAEPRKGPLAALPGKLAPWGQRNGAAAGSAFAAMAKEQQAGYVWVLSSASTEGWR